MIKNDQQNQRVVCPTQLWHLSNTPAHAGRSPARCFPARKKRCPGPLTRHAGHTTHEMDNNTLATCDAKKNSTANKFDHLPRVDREAVAGALHTVAGELHESNSLDFLREVVALAGGDRIGVRVGVIEDTTDEPLIEFFGDLPRAVSVRLRRAYANWERHWRGGVSRDDCWAVWHTSANGYGARFEITGLSLLVDLIAECRVAAGGMQ